ncbi:hypothetical protein ES703_22802 [subsurface metagenome]
MENELRLAIKLFENKINKVEDDYKLKHKGKFEKEKMSKYVNKKLEREIKLLVGVNLIPSASIINISKRFKY